ncbi:hypothetical protein Q5P01_002349 [Channa striata]|uniref:Uncharacterized protein n=1 Tax=Channa striata TaxID=64152 RepID=A0AA88T3N3_CHASR|nr:hypothetical protein Q5P01_002349 [Channa striata]
MFLCLLLVLLLVCSTQANQFLGTVMSYYPGNTNANGSVTVDLRYRLNFQNCTNLSWECLSGNCGNESLVAVFEYMESNEEWCKTEGIFTRQVPSNAPFQLWLNGGHWIDSITNGIVNSRAVTLVELRNRSDIGKANSSPQTSIIAAVRVPSNCQRNFSLLAFDPDGDNVQCRYGNTSLSECNPCTAPSVISLSSSCSLSFSPTSSSNEGPYAVQLVMEDFPTQTITLTQTDGTQTTLTPEDAISKIPVQFVLWVDPPAPSCTEGLYLPVFVSPTPPNRAQLYTSVFRFVEINIQAEANISTISELLVSVRFNIISMTLGPGQFRLLWTPSVEESGRSYPICFLVTAIHNLSTFNSDLRCVIVTVINGTTTSATTPASTTPTDTTTGTTTSATTPASTTSTDTTTNTTTSATTPASTTSTDTTTNTTTSATTPASTTSTDTTTNTTTSATTPASTTSTGPTTNTTTSATTPASTTSTDVIGLRVKVSSTYQLSNNQVLSYIQQVKNSLMISGLPDFSVNIVSNSAAETTVPSSLA